MSAAIEKVICVERRSTTSPREHFNRDGDWLPRLIVWPEYNGLLREEFGVYCGEIFDDELFDVTYESWGKIISKALNALLASSHAKCTALEPFPNEPYIKKLIRKLRKKPMLIDVFPADLSIDCISRKLSWYDGQPVYLCHKLDFDIQPIRWALQPEEILDRSNLLPHGFAIFDFGIEEAVLEITFSEKEQEFISALKEAAEHHRHKVEFTDRHFISHWISVDPEWAAKEMGELWGQF